MFFFEKKKPKKPLRNWAEPIRKDRSQNNQKLFASFFQKRSAFFLGRYLEFALASMRWTIEGEAHLAQFVPDVPVVAAFWHQRLALMPALWLRVFRANGRRQGAVLVSRHRDGRVIGQILARFHVSVAYGSSARPGKPSGKGGAAGVIALQGVLERGGVAVITPDGPRGPRACGRTWRGASGGAHRRACAAVRRTMPAQDSSEKLGQHGAASAVRARRPGVPAADTRACRRRGGVARRHCRRHGRSRRACRRALCQSADW